MPGYKRKFSYTRYPNKRYRSSYRPTSYAINNQRMIGAGRVFKRNNVNTLPAVQRTSAVETKVLDVPVTTNQISTTATFTLLNPVQEGSGLNNREGRKISGKSLRITGQLGSSGVAPTGVPNFLRVMVIYDRQPGPLFPVIGDILATVDQAGAVTTTSKSQMNPNNMDRFAMLRDIRYDIPNDNVAGTSDFVGGIIDYNNQKVRIDEYIKIPGYDMHYNSTANPITNANVSTGAIYLVTFGNVAAATSAYAVEWTSRLRYLDC